MNTDHMFYAFLKWDATLKQRNMLMGIAVDDFTQQPRLQKLVLQTAKDPKLTKEQANLMITWVLSLLQRSGKR
jgi:hypothetical protein